MHIVDVDGPRQAMLGLLYATVRVVEYDLSWPRSFASLAGMLAEPLSGLETAVEHMGSTAVPGLAARPIIDIAVGLATSASVGQVVDALEPVDYQFRGDKAARAVCCSSSRTGPGTGPPTCTRCRMAVVGRYLAVRDRLRNDPAARTGSGSTWRADSLGCRVAHRRVTRSPRFVGAQATPSARRRFVRRWASGLCGSGRLVRSPVIPSDAGPGPHVPEPRTGAAAGRLSDGPARA